MVSANESRRCGFIHLKSMNLVGKSFPRKEGRKKVTGQALYVDDLTFPEMLHGVTVRSSVPRGRIKSISFDQPPAIAGGSDCNIPWNEFTVVTAKDIRDLKLGENCVALILNDQPYLADAIVNHPEEAIVLLAHPDKYLLEEARRHVSIEYEELPAIFSLQDSLAKKKSFGVMTTSSKSFWLIKATLTTPGRQAISLSRANTKPARRSSSTLRTMARLQSRTRPRA